MDNVTGTVPASLEVSLGDSKSQNDYELLMTVPKIQEALRDRKLYVVGARTGISYATLRKLADGLPCNYSIKTIQVVSSYLSGRSGDGPGV